MRAPRAALLVVVVVGLGAARPGVARGEAESVDQLLAAVESGPEGARLHAAERLYQLGQADRAVPRITAQLRDDDPVQRCLAARVLGLLRSGRAVASLAAALGDDDWAVRRDVAEALGQIGQPAAVPSLTRRLGDDHPRVRIAAIRSLAELGARQALPAALRREADPEVRLHLVEAIGSSTAAECRRALRRALRDDAESVRLLAASFLVEQGDADAVEVLGARLSSGATATAKREAAEALGRAAGAAAGPARERLALALVDPSTEVTLAAAASLVALGDPRGEEVLRSLASDRNPPEIRARAQDLLERSPSSENR